jgi:peptidoglycan-N-acetylglucosamine deacetylase
MPGFTLREFDRYVSESFGVRASLLTGRNPVYFPQIPQALGLAATAPTPAASTALADAPSWASGPNTTVVDTARGHGQVVSLTFDDGPNPPDTLRLLEVLHKRHVRAVFCLWGEHVREHPEVVRRIAAAGHVLCNHSMRHEDMATWTPEQIRADLAATNALIRAAVPLARIPYFRAPFGSWGQTPGVAARLGMQPLGWRLAIADWEPPGADVLVRRLRDGITPGAVVLMHDGGGDRAQTVEAVDRIVPELRDRGYRLTLPARRG